MKIVLEDEASDIEKRAFDEDEEEAYQDHGPILNFEHQPEPWNCVQNCVVQRSADPMSHDAKWIGDAGVHYVRV
jgi:hypothetical protein